MALIFAFLSLAARHGRLVLVLGLAAGIALPGVASAMAPFIGPMVAMLLFLAALRIGPRQAIGALGDLGFSLRAVLVLQCLVPVMAVLLLIAAGWIGMPLALGLVLMLAAAPISGSPHIAVMTGNDPAPALRQLVLGTALLPLTVVPVFWLTPTLGDPAVVLTAAGGLMLLIAVAAGGAFALRATVFAAPSQRTMEAIDGVSAIAMAIVVIGLMSAVGPALRERPAEFAGMMAFVFAVNLALQIAVATLFRKSGRHHLSAPLGIVAGNRNIALFLSVLPASTTEELLLFIGCYQVPMYVTPILLGRFYAAGAPRG
jgi:arsenite transporter